LCEANPRGTKRQKQAELQAAVVDAVDKRQHKLKQAQCAKEQEIELI
jgi:hypothetical protein